MSNGFESEHFDSSDDLQNWLRERVDDVDGLSLMVVNDLPVSGPNGERALMKNCCGIIKTCTGESKLIHREELQSLLNDGVLQRMGIPLTLVPMRAD